MKKITKWVAEDGKEFDSEIEANTYEHTQRTKNTTLMDRYLKHTYSGKELMKKHALEDVGVWQVYGEDPNCDLGGSHHQPLLGTFSGKLKNIVAKGVTMQRFWTWGAGGDFKLITIEEIL